jgi:hypothetical protein
MPRPSQLLRPHQALTTIHALLISPSPRVLLAADGSCTRNFVLTFLPSIMTRLRRILDTRFSRSLWWQQFNPFLNIYPICGFHKQCGMCIGSVQSSFNHCRRCLHHQKTLTMSLTRKCTCKRIYSKNARFHSGITLRHGLSTSRSVFPRAAAIADGRF